MEIKKHDQVFYSFGNGGLFVGIVMDVRDKAVFVHYDIDSAYNNATTVYRWSVWLPKAVLIHERECVFGIKSWFVVKGGLANARNVKKWVLGENCTQKFI